MKKLFKTLILLIWTSISIHAQVEMNFDFDTPYGINSEAGKYIEVNGAQIYYEVYGTGEPILLIHGNNGNIRVMGNQIDYFKSRYKVIIADSRGQGKSQLATDSLTYEQIASDLSVLIKKLNLPPVNVIGWSDGGIVALLIGINHPETVNKIVAMGASLRPDTSAAYQFAVDDSKRKLLACKEKLSSSSEDSLDYWETEYQIVQLLVLQPNIGHSALHKIKAPVLVIAGDKDIIREEHSVEIYQNIPKAQLCILPGETHFVPVSNPQIFNPIAEKFIVEKFHRPDSDFTKW